jgi:glutamate carboxypeptidase
MRPSLARPLTALLALAAGASPLAAQATLTRPETRLRDVLGRLREEQVAYLQRVVDIPSSTLNLEGVRRVGAVFRASFDSLGFTTRWVAMPEAMRRAGHLVAEHRGRPGAPRLLLIGHLDTVVEPAGPTFARRDSLARGVGSGDMKGGDVIILYALKALAATGELRDLDVTVIMTGDEEHPGDPLDDARRELLDLARRSDLALAFEGGARTNATTARRGASEWRVEATGRQAHSAGVFGAGAGYGAVYELARILDGFRQAFAGQEYLTMNAAVFVGGTEVQFDTVAIAGSAATKTNIVPKRAVAMGDLRFISERQKEATRARMREIVAQHLPGTGATITFADGYPAMSPTAGNAKVLAEYDGASRALGHGGVEALDPGARGAGDISFVAPLVDGLDGLGAVGRGAHNPDESVHIPMLWMQTERAAVLLHRLGKRARGDFQRVPVP